jgi:hypothetical protein
MNMAVATEGHDTAGRILDTAMNDVTSFPVESWLFSVRSSMLRLGSL